MFVIVVNIIYVAVGIVGEAVNIISGLWISWFVCSYEIKHIFYPN